MIKNGEQDSVPDGFEERIEKAEGSLLPSACDGIPAARIPAANLIDFMTSLKEGPGLRFEMLTDVCSVDEHEREPRFDVVYHVRSLESGDLVRIKVFTEGTPPSVPSVVSIYPTADWHEREAFDMMGIRFEGHPDLKRILMPLEYEGYPLRKDFPLEGVEPDRLFKRLYPE